MRGQGKCGDKCAGKTSWTGWRGRLTADLHSGHYGQSKAVHRQASISAKIKGEPPSGDLLGIRSPRVQCLPNPTAVWSCCRPIVGHVTRPLVQTSVGEPNGGREDRGWLSRGKTFEREREESRRGWRSFEAPFQHSVALQWHFLCLSLCKVSGIVCTSKFDWLNFHKQWLVWLYSYIE